MSINNSRPVFTRVLTLIFAVALARLAAMIYAGFSFTHGDFFAAFPGPFAEEFNPTLWNSVDRTGASWQFIHRYAYGPTMYLTLLPLMLFDSYEAIARFLVPVYTGVIAATAYLIWRICRFTIDAPNRVPQTRNALMFIGASVFLFTPIIFAFVERNFEIVLMLALTAAILAVAHGRIALAAALLGYITPFKYWPIAFLGYFLLKREWKASAVFAAVMGLVLAAANAIFDLDHWPNQFGIMTSKVSFVSGADAFCLPLNQTYASLRSGICAATGGNDRAALVLYLLLAGVIGLAFLWTFVRLEFRARQLSPEQQRWRRTVEFSLFVVAAPTFAHGHYYYLCMLIGPLTLLLYKHAGFGGQAAPVKLAMTLLSYFLLAAFVVPYSVSSRLFRMNVQEFYNNHGIYAYGGLLLFVLLLWEYASLRSTANTAVTEPVNA